MAPERQSRWAIAIILLVFFILSLAYSVVNPLHEATDELRHYRFVQNIVQYRALPVQGQVGCSAQGHHPPLYYSLAALASGWVDTGRDVCYEPEKNPFWAYNYWEIGRDNKNQYLHGPDEAFPWAGEALAAHLARIVNILIGTAVVFVTWIIGRTIWPQRPFLAVGSAAIVAFNPMFLFMSGAINNDIIAALAGALVTLACVRLLRADQGLQLRWGIILGILYGIALLSKFNLAAIVITIELVITWVAWRNKQWRQWFMVNVLLVISAVIVAGWWFVRNQMLYGEPTGIQRLTELWGVRDPGDSLGLAFYELPYVWTSLWGRFGYGQIPLPQITYNLLWWLALFAITGLLIPLIRRQKEELREYGIYVLVLFVNVGLFFGVIFNYLLVSPAGPMGRFFFPALPSLALLLFYGAGHWLDLLPKREGASAAGRENYRFLAIFVTLGLFGLSLIALFGYLAPAYARPAEFAEDAALPNPNNARFDAFVILRGYEVEVDEISPGESFYVDLYWEVVNQPPGNFLQFVHLIDEAGVMVTQRDTHPGLGNFPSSQWSPGDRYVDRVLLALPETAYTPGEAILSTGYYAPVEGYRLAVYMADGTIIGDALPLDTISIIPRNDDAGELANNLQQNFSDKLMLLGYEYDRRNLHPGDTLNVALEWQTLDENLRDYDLQIRLLDETGAVIKTVKPELMGDQPTSKMQKGDVFVGEYGVRLHESLPTGTYYLQIVVKDAESRDRLPIVAEDGHLINDKIRLAGFRLIE